MLGLHRRSAYRFGEIEEYLVLHEHVNTSLQAGLPRI